jgi:putative hemolysin
LFEEISVDEFIFQGRMDLEDLNDVLDTHFTKDVADTLGGYIYGEIGHVPTEGEKVLVEDWELIVEKVIGRSIRKVRAKRRLVVQNEEDTLDET